MLPKSAKKWQFSMTLQHYYSYYYSLFEIFWLPFFVCNSFSCNILTIVPVITGVIFCSNFLHHPSAQVMSSSRFHTCWCALRCPTSISKVIGIFQCATRKKRSADNYCKNCNYCISGSSPPFQLYIFFSYFIL